MRTTHALAKAPGRAGDTSAILRDSCGTVFARFFFFS